MNLQTLKLYNCMYAFKSPKMCFKIHHHFPQSAPIYRKTVQYNIFILYL